MGFVKIDLDKKPEFKHVPENKNELREFKDHTVDIFDRAMEEIQPDFANWPRENKIIWAAMKISEYSGEVARCGTQVINNDIVDERDAKEAMAKMLFYIHVLNTCFGDETVFDTLGETTDLAKRPRSLE